MQAVQLGHALIEYSFHNPVLYKEWHDKSNYLCYLSVKNEEQLYQLVNKAKANNIEVVEFLEPDLDGALTAVALEPTVLASKLCSQLPLAFKNR